MWIKEDYIMDELEEAHKDYERRQAEIISKLMTIRDYAALQWHEKVWLNQAIEFIKEREI